MARAVPWSAIQDRLRYHQYPIRQTPSTVLPYQVGTAADRRCHYVRVVSVPGSPRAPLGVLLEAPRLKNVVAWALPVTEECWTVPAGCTIPDTGDVPPSTEEATASAAYRARKPRHADMKRGGPAQAGSADRGPRPWHRLVPRPGEPPSPRRGRLITSRSPAGPEATKRRRAHGEPRVQARAPATYPRRSPRQTPTGTGIRTPVVAVQGRLMTM